MYIGIISQPHVSGVTYCLRFQYLFYTALPRSGQKYSCARVCHIENISQSQINHILDRLGPRNAKSQKFTSQVFRPLSILATNLPIRGFGDLRRSSVVCYPFPVIYYVGSG